MSFKKVLLINPVFNVEWKGVTPPIGLGYLAETLLQAGIEYAVVDMNLGHSFKQLCQRMDSFEPDLIGISLITRDYYELYEFLGRIKEYKPRAKTIAGGPHVTIMKKQVLRECPALDFGVVHEGESTLVELCKGEIPVESIRGLLHRRSNQIEYTGDREYIRNLDQIPWPRYQGFEMDKYFKEANIYSSRGCPYHCIFCARPLITSSFRTRSAANVVDEMEYWYGKGYRHFNFEDDNSNLVKERVYEICDEIDNRGLNNLLIRCSNGLRADCVDRNVLARMYEVGYRYLAFGVDAGNNRMLNVVKKGETMEQIEDAIRNACELGFTVKLFFVFGNPTETTQDVIDMAKLSLKYPISEVHFNSIVPYPGTELFQWVQKNDYFLRPVEDVLNNAAFMDVEPVFETPELPRAERIRLKRYMNQVRREVHRRSIRRSFKNRFTGYCASYVATNSLFEHLYYKNRLFRGFAEHFRYSTAKKETTKGTP